MKIDLVIFDCDGVIIDSEIISAKALVSQMKDCGFDVNLQYVLNNFIGRSFSSVKKVISQTYGRDLPSDFEKLYLQHLLAQFETELRLMDGVVEVLENLSVSYCVATSSSPVRAMRSMEIVDLKETIGERLYTASEVRNGKPAPDLFLHASKKMGYLPENCLVIEDSPSGILAGKAAGMSVWQFCGGSHLKPVSEKVKEEFPEIVKFDKWSEFFEIAPSLKLKS
ncbi:MAG: HAD family hydrolase [Proteobacteria bacterium]|nr:HAD family hydrolase [Pseudomonadota bacterium]